VGEGFAELLDVAGVGGVFVTRDGDGVFAKLVDELLDGFAVELSGVEKLLELAEVGDDFLDAWSCLERYSSQPSMLDVAFSIVKLLAPCLMALMVVSKRVVDIL
jgi:hypothetical protein